MGARKALRRQHTQHRKDRVGGEAPIPGVSADGPQCTEPPPTEAPHFSPRTAAVSTSPEPQTVLPQAHGGFPPATAPSHLQPKAAPKASAMIIPS